MSFLTMLYTVLLKPLTLLFEIVYNIAYRNIGNPGLSIIALSLAINFLVLPLYRRADAMQEEERRRRPASPNGSTTSRRPSRATKRP